MILTDKQEKFLQEVRGDMTFMTYKLSSGLIYTLNSVIEHKWYGETNKDDLNRIREIWIKYNKEVK